MTKPSDLYPLSTADGKDIPFEVVRPLGFIQKDVGTTGSEVANLPIGSEDKILSLRSSVDCYITFSGLVADIPADGLYRESTIFIPANTNISVVTETLTYSVIGLVIGKLYINILETWRGLSMPSQFTRR